MTINVPDVGENLILEALVNKTSPQDLVLKLFQNDVTPSDTDTAATYTEATFSGYAALTLTGATWGAASGGSIAYPMQTFTSDAAQTLQNIYGYYMVQATSGKLVLAERFTNGPYAVTNQGDKIDLTPTITAS